MSTTTQQDQAESPARRVLDHIAKERFTGFLRVRSREASGEFWFLVGILENAQFGVSKGEEAIERLLRATEVVFELELRLPHLSGGFKKRMPSSGSFAETRPVALMRYCETYALTCSLILRGKDRTVRVSYRLGELLSADTADGGNEALPALLESEEGAYEFVLPTLELPVGVNTIVESAPKLSLAERIDRSLAAQGASDANRARPEAETTRHVNESAEAKRKADEAAAAEAKRKADEAAAAEAKRKADQAAAAEAKRKADQAAAAEAKRKADEAAAAAAKRKADEAVAAEAKRKADQAAAAEAKRKADEAAAAEAKRKADEAAAAEAKRKADEAAAAEAKRKADEAAAAEAKRKLDDAAEAEKAANATERDGEGADREPSPLPSQQELPVRAAAKRNKVQKAPSDGAGTAAVASPKRGFPWLWLILVLIAGGVGYFALQHPGLR